jgi:hypothetical protein
MNERIRDRFADDDPEYDFDAVDDVELDMSDVDPTDPKDVPPDQGDSGNADPAGDEG